jgi:hypothetical protein
MLQSFFQARIHIFNGVINKIQLLIKKNREREILMISALAFMIVYFKLLYSMWVQTHLHCITNLNQVLKPWLDQSSIKGGSQNEAILFSRVAHKNEVKLIYWPAFYNESLKLLWLSISSMWMQTHLHCIRNQSTRF